MVAKIFWNYYHDLVGQESRMVHDIAYLGNEEQKFDISMIMSHGGKKSFSDIHTLGALSGNSKKIFPVVLLISFMVQQLLKVRKKILAYC